jgi:perosamine synthetase
MKQSLIMSDTIPIIRPELGDQELKEISRVIGSGWITQGPEVAAFESEFAEFVDAPHATAVANCTAALHLALLALGIGEGDEVITVSHSFIATANAIRYCRAKPIFVDIQPGTFNIDPAQVEKALTKRTRAILCVHQLGMPCDLTRILKIGRLYGIPVVEDAASAIGSEIRVGDAWEKIGKPHGDIACFSFNSRNLLTTGDGGMITTKNSDRDAKFKLLRQHAMSSTDVARHNSKEVIVETYPELGFNYRMTDLQAAIGRVQLKKIPEIIRRRREQVVRYHELLSKVKGLQLPAEPEWAKGNWQSYCIGLPDQVEQKAFMQAALDEGISTCRGGMCSHREPAYRDFPKAFHALPLKESERAQDRFVILPLYHQMTEGEQDRIVEFIARICG